MASNSSFFEAFSSQGLWVIRTGRKFFQFSQRLNSDKKLIEIGFLQRKYAFLENTIFGLYSDQNGENHGVVRCCL